MMDGALVDPVPPPYEKRAQSSIHSAGADRVLVLPRSRHPRTFTFKLGCDGTYADVPRSSAVIRERTLHRTGPNIISQMLLHVAQPVRKRSRNLAPHASTQLACVSS